MPIQGNAPHMLVLWEREFERQEGNRGRLPPAPRLSAAREVNRGRAAPSSLSNSFTHDARSWGFPPVESLYRNLRKEVDGT